MNTWPRSTVVSLVAAGLTLAATVPASAADDDVTRRGSCSASSTWKLKAKPDDGRLEVEAEVDSNVRGQQWNWRILHGGEVSARGTARTAGASGSFTVERRLVDSSGTDRIGFRASNPSTGEQCVGRLSI